MKKIFLFVVMVLAVAMFSLFGFGGLPPSPPQKQCVTVALQAGEGLPELLDRVGCDRTQLPVVMAENGISLAAMPYLPEGKKIRITVGCEVPVPQSAQNEERASVPQGSTPLWLVAVIVAAICLLLILACVLGFFFGKRTNQPPPSPSLEKVPPESPAEPVTEAPPALFPPAQEPQMEPAPPSPPTVPPSTTQSSAERPWSLPSSWGEARVPLVDKDGGDAATSRSSIEVSFPGYPERTFEFSVIGTTNDLGILLVCPLCREQLPSIDCEKHLAERHSSPSAAA